MSRPSSACVALLPVLLASGCALPAEEEPLGEASSALFTDNALTANALTANSIYPNALTANALTANALTANALTANALAAIRDPGAAGGLSRQLLRYIVSCALDASQSFAFSWTDALGKVHDETYPGWLGLEPTWASQPLSPVGQRMVSACLASRTNYYGTTVTISARSLTEPLKTLAGTAELADYPRIEGAFWGNVFTSTPWLNACFDAANVANSRQKKRECAAGHLNTDSTVSSCGIIRIAGDCKNLCTKVNGAGQYYPSCLDGPNANGASTKQVITTALP